MGQYALNRRDFLKSSALAAAAGVAAGLSSARAAAAYKTLPKAVVYSMLGDSLPDAERFALAKACGFDGVEIGPQPTLEDAKRLADAAAKAEVKIHSIIYGGWGAPLSDPDPAVVDKGKKEIEHALRTAQTVGADNILLVPAVVTEKVRYQEAYERSQKGIRELLPLAEELKVQILVEVVWNKFLLSPVEFAQYVDDFESPWLQAYFDVGNVVLFAYSEDWIRTLGQRIKKVHLKDFKREGYAWTPLYEGSVNWAEVRKALDEVGYTGWITAELGGGDEAYLKEVSRRMTLIGEGAAAL